MKCRQLRRDVRRAARQPVHRVRSQAYLSGLSFFPSLISAPFHAGLQVAFDFAIVACLIAAVASLLRGKRYAHEEHSASAAEAAELLEAAGNPGVTPPAEVPVAIAESLDESSATPEGPLAQPAGLQCCPVPPATRPGCVLHGRGTSAAGDFPPPRPVAG